MEREEKKGDETTEKEPTVPEFRACRDKVEGGTVWWGFRPEKQPHTKRDRCFGERHGGEEGHVTRDVKSPEAVFGEPVFNGRPSDEFTFFPARDSQREFLLTRRHVDKSTCGALFGAVVHEKFRLLCDRVSIVANGVEGFRADQFAAEGTPKWESNEEHLCEHY